MKRRSPIHAYKRLLANDHNWDYAYLITAHNTWLHQSFSGDMKFRKLENGLYQLDDTDRNPIADYPVYVNVRNERRFFRATPIRDAQTERDRDRAILSTVNLRQQKALHLYKTNGNSVMTPSFNPRPHEGSDAA